MRTARLVGLSQDGQSLVVATDAGEEHALPVDDRLRATLRGDRPRLGQLEIEMESVLSPRDIQARIRAGASLEEVARISGMPADRVERFAGPVLLERDHMAGQAMASSVRRRGETSGHKNLRLAVTERLADRGIDPDTVDWDARRMDDGRWAVTAEYRSGEHARLAEFHFDPRGRYSVAGNEEARWVLGESTPVKGPQPGRRRIVRAVEEIYENEAAEPTLDLNDELALVRAVQVDEPDPGVESEDTEIGDSEPGIPDRRQSAADEEADSDSGLETLYGLLGGEGYAEDSVAVYSGLREESPGPVGWEPEIVVDHPAATDRQSATDGRSTTDQPAPTGSRRGLRPAPEPEPDSRAEPIEEERIAAEPAVEPEPELEPEPLLEQEPLVEPEPEPAAEPEPAPAKPKRTKKKRASVPSWDEIMFGGPPRKD